MSCKPFAKTVPKSEPHLSWFVDERRANAILFTPLAAETDWLDSCGVENVTVALSTRVSITTSPLDATAEPVTGGTAPEGIDGITRVHS